jgi:hypothetical protein
VKLLCHLPPEPAFRRYVVGCAASTLDPFATQSTTGRCGGTCAIASMT